MSAHTEAPATVRAQLNFAADRTDGGIWSNLMRHLITQPLEAREVEIRDARRLPGGPSLENEGFVVSRTPAPSGADFEDADWVARAYAPQCLKLVQELTGAAHVASFYGGGVLIRDTGRTDRAPAAEFVHLDHSRDSARPFLEQAADPEARRRWPRVKIFNIWRVLTPPPQDVPLALCDQRTLDPADWVVGRTVEPNFPDGVPYVSSVFNPQQRWFYLSDLTPDDVVVFKGYDSDPEAPFGCLHGAFRQPAPPSGAAPRASAEARVFAFFDA
jgi:hypothetical protein